MMRKINARLTIGVAALVLAGSASGLAVSGASGASTKTKAPKPINLSGVTLNVGDLGGQTSLLLNASGALKGAAYKVNFSTFPAGPQAVAAIQGGSIDVAMTADTPAIFAQAGNVPLKVVAAGEPVNPGSAIGIVVAKNSPITTLADLKGATIAVADGTILQYVAIQALNNNAGGFQNATLDNLAPPLELSAFGAGSVQAAVLIEPYLAEAEDLYGGQLLASGSKFTKGYDYFLASNAALANAKKTAAIENYLSRVAKAENWASKNEATWAQDYATANSISLPLAQVAVEADLTSFVKIGPNQYNATANEAVVFEKAGLLTTKLNTKLEFSTVFNSVVPTFAKG
jgi:sulfonate transport system substrate-binding protein